MSLYLTTKSSLQGPDIVDVHLSNLGLTLETVLTSSLMRHEATPSRHPPDSDEVNHCKELQCKLRTEQQQGTLTFRRLLEMTDPTEIMLLIRALTTTIEESRPRPRSSIRGLMGPIEEDSVACELQRRAICERMIQSASLILRMLDKGVT